MGQERRRALQRTREGSTEETTWAQELAFLGGGGVAVTSLYM